MKQINRMLAVSLTGLVGALAPSAFAQISITSTAFTYEDNFTGFDGNADPTGWTTSDAAAAAASGWQGTGNGTSTTGGKWSFGDTGSSSTFDGSLGFLPSSTRAINADISFINNTGITIDGFTLGYVGEHWRSANEGRNNGWAVSYQINSGSFIDLNDLTYVAVNTFATGINPDGGPWAATSLSQTVSGITLEAGDSITFRFFGDNGIGGGSRQGVAIDNFSLTGISAVPEPAAFAFLMGASVLGLVVARRRRRS